MVINQSICMALKFLINCRSWHLLTQCHILISLVLHHLMAKVGNSQHKAEIRWLVGRWHVMTCPCCPFEPTKVYGSTNKQFSLRHVVTKTSGNRNLVYDIWRTSLSFTAWRKKTTQKSKVRPIQAMMIRFSTLITTQAVKLHSHHTSKSTACFPFQKVTTE